MSKGSKMRRRAIAQDAERRARYAFSTGNRTNPYPSDDPRFELFVSQLLAIEAMDREVRNMYRAYGHDPDALVPLVHADPGPVVPIEELVSAS